MRRQILSRLESAGVKARFAKLPDFVAAADRQHLPGCAAEVNYLAMMPGSGTVTARFDYNTPTASPATQPVITTDTERRVVAIGPYSSVR